MRMRLLFAMLMFPGGAVAADSFVSVELGPVSSLHSERYFCGAATPFEVQYATVGPTALAIIPVDGEPRVFVNVVAASGARYVSGAYTWWTKGDSATLSNQIDDSSRTCSRVDAPRPE
ncbi:MAG: hypothetical protein CMH69_14200 [Nitratireductor sp.]|nr:hypothetical protein [Nitratireductor sp.]